MSGYMTDEQRDLTGWISVPKWVVIVGRALSICVREISKAIRLLGAWIDLDRTCLLQHPMGYSHLLSPLLQC